MTDAGWYQDPYGVPGLVRWWDGRQWTDATRPAEGEATWGWGAPQQVWVPAQEARRRHRVLIPVLAGVVAVVAVVALVAVLLTTGVIGRSRRSAVAATITDTSAGLSYPRLSGWAENAIIAGGGLDRLGFDLGESIHVMENYQNGQPYVASAYSGTVPSTYSGDLQTQAKALLDALEPVAYPAHTRHDLSSGARSVSGHGGWMIKVEFDFPEAKSRGWNFHNEKAAIVLLDRGSGQPPAEFYVSVPDSHKKPGDFDLLLSSLKVA